MLTIWDHLLLWGAFFVTGFMIGFVITYLVAQAGKKLRY